MADEFTKGLREEMMSGKHRDAIIKELSRAKAMRGRYSEEDRRPPSFPVDRRDFHALGDGGGMDADDRYGNMPDGGSDLDYMHGENMQLQGRAPKGEVGDMGVRHIGMDRYLESGKFEDPEDEDIELLGIDASARDNGVRPPWDRVPRRRR